MNGLDINKKFREIGRTLGCCESFTGGAFAQEITKYPGASHFFKGGLVTYATEEKSRILGIGYDLIDRVGVVSQEVAAEMAGHAKVLLNVDYCISFTGNAGPVAIEDKPVGEIYIGVSVYDTTRVYKYNFEGNREEIITQAIEEGIKVLIETLEEKK